MLAATKKSRMERVLARDALAWLILAIFSIQIALGNTIYYNQISLPDGAMTLRRVNADGTGNQPVPVPLPSAAFPNLSRDGRRLLVTSPDPVRPFLISRNVFVLDLLAGTIGKVTAFEDIYRNKLRQKGSVQVYKDAGCGGPTLYRHNEGANLAFHDGHAERIAQEKVWIPDNFYGTPHQPGMWVARLEVWES